MRHTRAACVGIAYVWIAPHGHEPHAATRDDPARASPRPCYLPRDFILIHRLRDDTMSYVRGKLTIDLGDQLFDARAIILSHDIGIMSHTSTHINTKTCHVATSTAMINTHDTPTQHMPPYHILPFTHIPPIISCTGTYKFARRNGLCQLEEIGHGAYKDGTECTYETR